MAIHRTFSGPDPERFSGIYHLAASGRTSWHGFAEAIFQRMPVEGKKCVNVEAISSAEYALPAQRPKNSVLNCGKLQSVFGLQLPDWQAGLDLVTEELRK